MAARNPEGFTLFELLVVIGIIGAAMGLVVGLYSNMAQTQLRRYGSGLAGTIRYLYNEAAMTHQSFRLVFDLSHPAYWVEATSVELGIQKAADEDGKKSPSDQGIADDTESPAGQTEADEGTLEVGFTEVGDRYLKRVILPEDIHFKDIWVEHQTEPVQAGQATLYFFPHGQTETAVINLADQDDSLFLSLVVKPLTGQIKTSQEYVDYTKLYQ